MCKGMEMLCLCVFAVYWVGVGCIVFGCMDCGGMGLDLVLLFGYLGGVVCVAESEESGNF